MERGYMEEERERKGNEKGEQREGYLSGLRTGVEFSAGVCA
jgi:hypothetical protein